ncbi:TetR/AcrR family transcriptional regulator [Streptomyces sp. NPDC057363]|uniref:TetR/AcrR family transcriptional regulator n=1 Tax=Streptomyces sp. NPDC057363 TaxID=3346107 RepID=UPI00363DD30B
MVPPTHPRTTTRPSPRQSRISPEREAQMYAAVIDMLRETGYDALSMEAIATRVRWSKATLYRRFSGKQELVAMALRHQSPLRTDTYDTGSLAGDLHAMVDARSDQRLHADAALLRGVFRALHTDEELGDALRAVDHDELGALVSRAVRRGELAEHHPAIPHLPHLFVSALVAHPLIEGGPANRDFLHRYVDAVILSALGTEAPPHEA